MTGLADQPFKHDPSATAAFAALPDAPAGERPKRKTRAVVIGGGTGAPMSIRTLLSMGVETAAVVVMADDGGSTGILRDQAGATAPGDIRKCITAMAADADDPLTMAFKARFGFAENHTLGNLMLAALEVTANGFPNAIDICERLLNARGHVYPSTLDRVTLVSKTKDGRTIIGQATANHSRTALKKVMLESDGVIAAYEPALEAIRKSDIIVLGPGSLFTSIVSCLIVPGVIDAIADSDAVVVFVSALTDQQGETRGMSLLEHYQALVEHGMGNLIDFMFVHDMLADPPAEGDRPVKRLLFNERDLSAIESAGTRVMLRDLSDVHYPSWHDPAKLRHAFSEVLS